MSTIHTEASVAASEVEPSATDIYDYSESIVNDNDDKLDEGLRAPIPIHDDDLDTSLLSDNELEAFVKTKQYTGKAGSIPGNLLYIYQRLSGNSKWDPKLYKQTQTPSTAQLNHSQSKQVRNHHHVSEVSIPRAVTNSYDPSAIHIAREQSTEQSYSEMETNGINQLPPHPPEPTPFASVCTVHVHRIIDDIR